MSPPDVQTKFSKQTTTMDNDEDKINTINYCLEVKKTVENFLKKLGVAFEEIEVFKGLSSSGPKFIIKSQESGLLIGHRGDSLRALNHLIKRIVFKNSGVAKFTIDINNYQEENIKRIRNQAMIAAEKAKDLKSEVELEPMSSYERMIVHSLLSTDPKISTESIGERDQRRVVIKFNN